MMIAMRAKSLKRENCRLNKLHNLDPVNFKEEFFSIFAALFVTSSRPCDCSREESQVDSQEMETCDEEGEIDDQQKFQRFIVVNEFNLLMLGVVLFTTVYTFRNGSKF